jgi:putative NADH-flavin reductase
LHRILPAYFFQQTNQIVETDDRKTLAVFGATGRTGKHIVSQALNDGYAVHAFVRNLAKLSKQQEADHDRLHPVQGDVTNEDDVGDAVAGSDVVLSALGHAEGAPDDVQTVGTQHMLNAMAKHDVRRIVSETGAGVSHPDDEEHWGARIMSGMLKLFQPAVLEDAENHADALQQSDRDWIIVRAPRLTNGEHTGTYRTGYLKMGPTASISRADVAHFMLSLATGGDEYVREMPMICY